jgi:hypothetical protein
MVAGLAQQFFILGHQHPPSSSAIFVSYSFSLTSSLPGFQVLNPHQQISQGLAIGQYFLPGP